MKGNLLTRFVGLASHFLKYSITILFYLRRRKFRYTSKNTIAVFAQPRGGSTWFTDLLLTIPHSAKIDGPLFQGRFLPDGTMPSATSAKLKSYSKLKFYFFQHIPEGERYPEAREFFQRLFSHHFFTPYIYQETSLKKLFFSEKYIFKFYQANLLLPWIVNHFDVKPILLIRNPYAVVASQMKHYAFQDAVKAGKYVMPEFRFSEFFDLYREILKTISQPEEILAAMWCLNFQPVISHEGNNRKWLTISYEGLLMNPEMEIRRLFTYLDEAIPEKLSSIYGQPSGSTSKSSQSFKDKKAHLGSWKKALNQTQIDNIETVLTQFGVKGYTQAVEPDYEYIYHLKVGS